MGPLPSVGSSVGIDGADCPNFTQPLSPLQNTTQVIPEISSLLGLAGTAQVVGCRQVVLTQISGDLIQARPIGGRVPCGLQQTN